MGNSVYAENMGFFHKASGGKGVAPGDVCLSPPPPPAGPVPVPYVNMLQASDLAQGSKTVKIMGTPTALENASHVSTSTGNEAGTQGGGVVTHKTKGKGSFKLWSFVVKAEGKGVCRHGDPMEQNTASPLPNTVDLSAMVDFGKVVGKAAMKADCPRDYDYSQDYTPTTGAQRRAVQNQACWNCKKDRANIARRVQTPENIRALARIDKKIARQKAGKVTMIADHQPPQKVAWEMGGCHAPGKFADRMKDLPVSPHCQAHSNQQAHDMRRLDRRDLYDTMNANIPGLSI
ncbi:DUF4150 domain-containing protein [Defluviimonas aestuarii]|uniref:DUF4150 domain-containing protein n=1 Tax=Albidovulum aestuarii TaxID=1130726 RepID=UPI00249BD562|nr:DUF4150 domain-containing protein [Defluviimonas aestuarii]MDI3337551.1 DUF4150 domain-containing protein [Defluviimonas aestuarii]